MGRRSARTKERTGTLRIMKLKPWYKIVTPREDLREGKPLDAAEFAVHLDKVRDGSGPADYSNPKAFFEKTFITSNILELSSQVVRRLAGEKTETSAIFNLATQFGGGKTHSLTLLYHLCKHGEDSRSWTGVDKILSKAGVSKLTKGEAAVFVGTEFDSISGRGGDDGTPKRMTPWGEIAFQLGGQEAFDLVAEHEKSKTAPGGDVITKMIPKNKPCLILMDELMNFISRNRKSGLSDQFYYFLHNLSETARSLDNVVLAVSIPASEMEMTEADQQDYDRVTKMLDRLGKAIMMSAKEETSEIIRRRLFEWDLRAISAEGRIILDRDASDTCQEYANWIRDHSQQIPQWFSPDQAGESFKSAYPFHPSVLSVFERKWRGIQKFQQTRGMLRLLALWVSQSYTRGFKDNGKDYLIGLGSAPLGYDLFRTACFEQLGERHLETAITTDIDGGKNSHAGRLDQEAIEDIKKSRLHSKVATSIFFESNGGQLRGKEASLPEIRLAVGDPQIDLGNIETVLDALTDAAYYLQVEGNRYAFGLKENLNKRYADHRANIKTEKVDDKIDKEIRRLFVSRDKRNICIFPEKSIQISDQPALTFVISSIKRNFEDKDKTLEFIDKLTKESGTSNRTFKSALVWCVADSERTVREEAKKLLAWEGIEEMSSSLNLDDTQKIQLSANIKKSAATLTESIWRAYKHVIILGKNNELREIDLGLITSSAAQSPLDLILRRLMDDDVVTKQVVARIIVRNWSPAFKEWSTKSVRDAFFASPKLPRLLEPELLRDTIARGVSQGSLGYIGKTSDGKYEPFHFNCPLEATDVELAEDMFIVTADTANEYQESLKIPEKERKEEHGTPTDEGTTETNKENKDSGFGEPEVSLPHPTSINSKSIRWEGKVPALKWMNFYTKVVSKYASADGVSLKVELKVEPNGGISPQKIEETKAALNDLGLDVGDFDEN